MLISKFDLYRGGWLDFVFKNRNHQYGAYALRNNYAGTMVKAMAATFLTLTFIGVGATIIARSKTVEVERPIIIDVPIKLPDEKVYEAKKPKEIQKPQKAAAVKPAEAPKTPQIRTQDYREMVAAPDELAEQPKPLVSGVAVSNTDNLTGKSADNTPISGVGEKPGIGSEPGTGDIEVFSTGGVQVMPEPVGGAAAWGKFLQKNLRYPPAAQENGVQGKTYMSFIIEKDGSLSNITVERKAGYGFDEEATRVLKLAKAWKPGMQNGQAVRVRYIIPINFQLAEQ